MKPGSLVCTVCNYLYEETDKSVSGFERLPDNWQCPECGADKDKFQPCSCVSFSRPELGEAQVRTANIGELVALSPDSAVVFEKYDIDYCCGGKLKLIDICRNKNLSLEKLVKELLEYSQGHVCTETDWTKTSLKELIDHIIQTYHIPLKKELVRIQKLASKVATVHGERHPDMKELANVFEDFKAQLELHMQKEEIVLFPAIIRMETGNQSQFFGCGGGIENPINVMLQEHDDAGTVLKKMRSLAADYKPPKDACNTFKVLLSALQNFEKEMHRHVHKENNILFPRALAITQPNLQKCC